MSLHLKFESSPDETGLDIIDPVENRLFSLGTDEPADPTPADTDEFAFPVDTARRLSVGEVRLPYMIPVDVRTPEGDPLRSVDDSGTHELANDDYLLELHSPIKVYLRVSGRVRIDALAEGVTLEFGEDAAVDIGARSYHSAPAATVTVPDDPEAMMRALSAFPSALKTTSPERAWPTLRGHPPRIERGDELDIPSDLDAPETGIRITIPSEYWAVYTVAPLAYYLGAEVVPGERARVTAETGVDLPLGESTSELADAVAALLKRVFFLDCIVRTEGLYPDELHERNILESHVELDFAELYDASPAERLAAYLSVPDEAIEAVSSPWHRVTHVEADPGPEVAELLPYLVDDLSLVRPKDASDDAATRSETDEELDEALDSFLRRPGASEQAAADGALVRSTETGPVRRSGGPDEGDPASENAPDEDDPASVNNPTSEDDSTHGVPEIDEYVPLPEVDALEQAWVGDGTPIRGTKLLAEAFDRETPESSDETIDITVVCNDDQMREESDSVDNIYGSRDDMPVSVTSKVGVSTDELRDLLAEDNDVFHFVGHIDGRGFQCPDGVLDAATLDTVNATTALLNGCRSHDQGIELVKTGASAAVVSLSDLFNSGAVEVGETLARLLHHGFSIGGSMKVIRNHTSIGNRYVVLGNSTLSMVQYSGLIPILCHVSTDPNNRETIRVRPVAYPTSEIGVGTTFQPEIFENDRYYIAVGEYDTTRIERSEFRNWVSNEYEPVILNGELTWGGTWLKPI